MRAGRIMRFAAGALCVLFASSVFPATWYVPPSGDTTGKSDAHLIQAAIDQASPGDTVVLMAGTFFFSNVSTTDFDIVTGTGQFKYYADWWSPDWTQAFADAHHQDINISKAGLTLRGERDNEGRIATVITTPLPIHDHGRDYWTGYNGTFLINAKNVTLRDLRIEKFVQPIWAWAPGFDIRENEFIESGFGQYLIPDNQLTYPKWPSTNEAIKSYYRNNRLVHNAQPPHVVGSEIEVANNDIDFYNFPLVIYPWGSLRHPDNNLGVTLPINLDIGRNNSLSGNFIRCNPGRFGSYGVGIWNDMSSVVNARIAGNRFENCRRGVLVTDLEADSRWNIEEVTIIENVFKNIRGNPINLWSGVDVAGIRGCEIARNTFENTGTSGVPPGAVWLEAGVRNCKVYDNDYALSGRPGWYAGNGLVWLDSGSVSNYVREFIFPTGTTMCDQIIDRGANAVMGYGACTHNAMQVLHLEEVLAKWKRDED